MKKIDKKNKLKNRHIVKKIKNNFLNGYILYVKIKKIIDVIRKISNIIINTNIGIKNIILHRKKIMERKEIKNLLKKNIEIKNLEKAKKNLEKDYEISYGKYSPEELKTLLEDVFHPVTLLNYSWEKISEFDNPIIAICEGK